MKLVITLITILTISIAGCTESDVDPNQSIDENPIASPGDEPILENITITKVLTISGYMAPTGWEPITPSATINNNCLTLRSYTAADLREITVSLVYSGASPSLVKDWRLGAISWNNREEQFVTGTLPLELNINNATDLFSNDPSDFIAIYTFPIDAVPSISVYEELDLTVDLSAANIKDLEYSTEVNSSCT
jgi:hypothetical protein